jgi:hypothetical protein
MLGMGMDLPLMDWLKTYTFKTEARFLDNDFARMAYSRLAAAYGSILVASCVLILVQAAQYYREGAFSPWFGYLIAAMLIPQAVFPALLRAGGD